MVRIQTAVSGGFDAAGGENIIEAVQGLVQTQDQVAQANMHVTTAERSTFSPVPDVRTDTVNRFAAVRFRTTFRSLRPLLEDREARAPHDLHEEEALDAARRPFSPSLI